MRTLSLFVAAFAVIAGMVGIHLNDPLVLLLSVAAFGEALTQWLSAALSRFLQIFSFVFGVETLIFGTVFLLHKQGLWPDALKQYLIPESLSLTVALFGIAVYAASHIPVIKQITRIADPYFDASEMTTARLWPFRSFTLPANRLAIGMVVFLVLINQVEVAIDVRLSFFSRDWFNAIQTKNQPDFWYQLVAVFLPWATVFVAAIVIEYVVTSLLVLRWRRFLTNRYTTRWLAKGAHYRVALKHSHADNPDQRIQEDVNAFINGGGNGVVASGGSGVYGYSITLVSTLTQLVSYALVLWGLSANFTIPGTQLAIPGFLFWVALIYAGLGTSIAHFIGRSLVKLAFLQQRFEASFRFGLARMREYSEQIALLGGEANEHAAAMGRFDHIYKNYLKIIGRRKKLQAFTAFYDQFSQFVPYIVAAPFYFAGKIQLGTMTQTARAFGSVQQSLNFFISYYTSLADFRAVLERLTTFDIAIDGANDALEIAPHIDVQQGTSPQLVLNKVQLRLPTDLGAANRVIVDEATFTLRRGESTLLNGPSGSGKSTLFRAISGIWPYGDGTIQIPQGSNVLLLPQRPYIPIGTLREAVTYPAPKDTYSQGEIEAALRQAQLPGLIDQIDQEDNWAQRLSGGEQQRLAIARALLAKPDWLFLDEATAALDEDNEARIYEALALQLPQTTIVSIGHRATLSSYHQRRIEMQPLANGAYQPLDVVLKAAE
ncbi:MAG: ABC transporter ATP-binding protein/permease [Hyphomicrobiales bacterium]|nr:ABC transporter ATP-binding protein/permease [Hyphomicrobiales bacterium]